MLLTVEIIVIAVVKHISMFISMFMLNRVPINYNYFSFQCMEYFIASIFLPDRSYSSDHWYIKSYAYITVDIVGNNVQEKICV